MPSKKSRINWKIGDIAIVKIGWDRVGTTFKVLGPAVFLKQWWVPIEDPDEKDPTFHKESGLELFEPKETYVPTSLRTYYEDQVTPEPRELQYGIGQLHASEPEAAIGMWKGPNPSLMEMLETVGQDNNSVLIEFKVDGTDYIIYRWDVGGIGIVGVQSLNGCWVKVRGEPQKVYQKDQL